MTLKRRWSTVCKDPEIGLKAERASTSLAPWPIVNHLSPGQVSQIVTDKVLKLDQATCKHILESMLDERKKDELKVELQMSERDKLRERIKDIHQNSLMVTITIQIISFVYSLSKR